MSLPSPFARIALSLSGGGFRASAYSLGTLKALYLLGLLDNVHLLSTASGGTITGAYYAMRRKAGHAFPGIYYDFYRFLEDDQLLPAALAQWEQNLAQDRPKLIHAFADTYCQALFGADTRLGLFWEPDAAPNRPFHLQTIIFGATELYSGLTFRFQHGAFLPPPKNEKDTACLVGNGNVRLPSQYARQLRLGDVVAASSCFPGGFEPLIMPDDFLPGEKDILRGAGKNRPPRIALLDGGIYDNQGIESLLLANERNRKHAETATQTHSPEQAALLQPSTLFLVADVSGAEKNIYQAEAAPAKKPGFSPSLGQTFFALLGLLLALGVAAGVLGTNPLTRFWGGLLAGIGLAVGAGLWGLLWGWRQLGSVLRHTGPALPGWVQPRLRRLSLRQLRALLGLRLGSTKALLTSVFMRRVRSLNYEQLYRPASQNKPAHNVLSSIIGTLVAEHDRQLARSHKKKASAKPPPVRQQLSAVYPTVLLAQEMPTTLWWQADKHRLPAIVASAEITLCYQLLRRFEKQAPSEPFAIEVQRRAQLIWAVYQEQGTGYVLPLEALSILQNPTGTVAQLLACNS